MPKSMNRVIGGYDGPATNGPEKGAMLPPGAEMEIESDEAMPWQDATTMPPQLVELPGSHAIESLVTTQAAEPDWSPV